MLNENNVEEVWEEEEPEEESTEEQGELTVRMRINTQRHQVPIRIDKYLMTRVEGATRNKIQHAIESGFILVNNTVVKPNYKIKHFDDIVVYETRRSETEELLPENIPLNIIYEDDALLIVNKPTGMVVHPGCGNVTGTLLNALAWHFKEKQLDTNGLNRIGLVHRIDKDTTGLVVIAKTATAMTNLAAQFKKHTVHRRYIALAWGDFDENEGTVIAHIGRNLRFRKIMDAFRDGDYGKEAITHYKVLERFNYVTLLELRLETGRTHQIRVHMKHIGHPLFNDSTYGGDRIVKGTVFSKYKQFIDNCFGILQRQALHAKEIGFTHPVTGEWMQFESNLPDDMLQVLEKWKIYTGSYKQIPE